MAIFARTTGAAAAAMVVLCALALTAVGADRGVVVSSARIGALGETQILVNAKGRALYRTSLACTGACAMEWMPLVIPTSSRLRAGTGVSPALLGRVRRPNGSWQVTYHGSPLYLFSGDTRAGEVNGQGMDGRWHVLTPAGVTVTRPVAAKSSASSSSAGAPPVSSSAGSGSGSGTGAGSSAGVGMWCAANPSSCVNGVPINGTTTTTAG
jgi:predicted lipoprotein with Yx(FWY)xxD motif